MLLPFGKEMPVTLVAAEDVEGQSDGASGGAWRVTGPRPQLRANLPTAPRAGTYRLHLSFFETDGLSALRILFDLGQGYSDDNSVVVYLRPTRRGHAALISVPPGTRALRIAPVESAAHLRLGTVRLRRLSTSLVRVGRMADVVRGRLRSTDRIAAVFRRSLAILRSGGPRALVRSVQDVVRREAGRGPNLGYEDWIMLYDTLADSDRRRAADVIAGMAHKPRFSILMPVYNTPRELLMEAIDSVVQQLYPDWELCIADDASTAPHIREVLEGYARDDARIKVVFRPENGHISKSSNTALGLATGDWIALLDHDDRLRPHSLYEVAVAISRNPDARLIYSDEDKLDEQGRRCDPYFKPDWNYELFLSQNVITHLAAIRADVMHEVGGFQEGMEGAQDYDLFLRIIERCRPENIVHIPKILYHWRRLPGSTALTSDEKPYAMLAGERALNAHLQRMQVAGTAELMGFGFRTRYRLPAPTPTVSIIIPTRDRLDLLQKCVSSIFEKTRYDAYDIIIVDNNSAKAETLAWLAEIAQDVRVKVIRDEREFNYSRLNNLAAAQASGQFLLMLNNDVEVISPDWLSEMVGVCSQPGIGAVGACLWYPDNTMQHGGVIMGLGGLAAHAHDRLPKGHPGYVGRAALRHEVSAVTGACLLTRREAFAAVEGLDEVNLKVAYNDIDYCLKLREAGWRIVWTPFAELYHFESASRGHEVSAEKKARFETEKVTMRQRWSRWIDNDPSYNPNLTLDDARFSLSFPPRGERMSHSVGSAERLGATRQLP